MVENLVKTQISDYQNKKIKTDIRLIIEISKLYNNDVEKVYNSLRDINFNLKKISQVIDAYLIIMKGSKVDPKLKEIFEKSEFIDDNESLIYDLAKIYFYCDSISFDGSQIIIKKDINLVEEEESPAIDIEKAICLTLQKIKYNKIDDQAILKIQELGNYNKYKELMTLLIKAIEYSNKIMILDDNECKMTINELRDFLK